MEIKNLFDNAAKEEILARISKLSARSTRQWGKMDIAQMLAHCKGPFKVALSSKPVPRMFIGRLLGWMVKDKLHNDKPWKQGLPTSPDFIIKGERSFDEEKAALISLINAFYQAGPGGAGRFPHPFFGKFTPDEWGKSMWKHLDHHLRQFAE